MRAQCVRGRKVTSSLSLHPSLPPSLSVNTRENPRFFVPLAAYGRG
jgi:hypothetical protein